MTILSDGTIGRLLFLGDLVISPIGREQIQPSSVDLRLDNTFRVFDRRAREIIDPTEENGDLTQPVTLADDECLVIHPGEFLLASTYEVVGLPSDIAGQLGGKSSLGRLGLIIHATAGFIDPGFQGKITLELSNVAEMPIRLRPMMKIGQISFWHLDDPAQRPYGHPQLNSKYQGQTEATQSAYWKNRARPT